MSADLIRTWLDLPGGDWPPNHYVLLGLAPGEADPRRIENQVHERMTRLRQYQLNHPEAATEAMNRIAQAFACLTDRAAKKAYDAELFPDRVPYVEEEKPAVPVVPMPALDPDDPLAWLYNPLNKPKEKPVQVFDWATLPPPEQKPMPVAELVPEQPAPVAEVVTPADPVDPMIEAGRESPAARRGLGTKRAIYQRIARTRQLQRYWSETGTILSHSKKKLAKPTDAVELVHQLAMIRQLMRGFPPMLGEAGQPGYLVVTLARQQMIVPTFRSLLGSQREALARDWRSGNQLLKSHLHYLRQEVKLLRAKNRWGRVVRAVTSFVTDQPGTLLFLLGLLLLNLALWTSR